MCRLFAKRFGGSSGGTWIVNFRRSVARPGWLKFSDLLEVTWLDES
jgi:hypothetical protein